MKIIKEQDDKVLIETDEMILPVQILAGIWLLSIPASLVVGGLNMWTDLNLGVKGMHVTIFPMIALAFATLNGAPCKQKWFSKDSDEYKMIKTFEKFDFSV